MESLWEHQTYAINEIRRSIVSGNRSNLIVSPTGSGKLRLLLECAKLRLQSGGKVLLAIPRDELISQAMETSDKMGLKYGVIAASGIGKPHPFQPFQIANSHTLIARDLRPECDLFMIDEAHHSPANELSQLVQYYRKGLVIGASATPSRGDGRGFGDLFDKLIVAISTKEAITKGILVSCEVVAPKHPLDPGQLAQDPIETYIKYASGLKTILFAKNRISSEEYAIQFNKAGISAASVTGNNSDSDRKQIIKDYREGQITVLCNCLIGTEGFDDRPTSCCILARSCGTQTLFLQIVGRILRTSPETNKKSALLIDLYGSSLIHGHPEEERIYSLHGEAITRKDPYNNPWKLCAICKSVIPDNSSVCLDCGHERPQPELPDIVNAPLFKYGWINRDTVENKIERISKWMREAITKGYKLGSVWWKANSVYSQTGGVTREEWHAAKRMIDERRD